MFYFPIGLYGDMNLSAIQCNDNKKSCIIVCTHVLVSISVSIYLTQSTLSAAWAGCCVCVEANRQYITV